MRFWDTSALVPLFIAERESGAAVKRLREDPEVVVWTLARLELLAALARRGREEPTAARQLALVRRHFLEAWERWSEVTAADIVRRHAERIVGTHSLRASDALHIGAALGNSSPSTAAKPPPPNAKASTSWAPTKPPRPPTPTLTPSRQARQPAEDAKRDEPARPRRGERVP